MAGTEKMSSAETEETSIAGTKRTSRAGTVETSRTGTEGTSRTETERTSRAGTVETSRAGTVETSRAGTVETSRAVTMETLQSQCLYFVPTCLVANSGLRRGSPVGKGTAGLVTSASHELLLGPESMSASNSDVDEEMFVLVTSEFQ